MNDYVITDETYLTLWVMAILYSKLINSTKYNTLFGLIYYLAFILKGVSFLLKPPFVGCIKSSGPDRRRG